MLAGPFAGQLLAEMGADVIKVEPPDGDPSRGIGPFLDGRSLYFSALNTGKRGIVLDLADGEGRDLLDALLATADVVIENFRPAAARKLRCLPEDLLAGRPELVVVSVTAFARDSDRATEPALDLSVQAESGIMSVTGEPGGPPVRAGVPIGDLAAGVFAALGAVSATVRRLRTGRGGHVEVPLLDSALTMLSYVATAAAGTGVDPPPVGAGHHSIVPYGAYPTADGWLTVPVIGDALWRRACAALGLDALAAREDLATNPGRHAAREEVDQAIALRLAALPTEEARRLLTAAGVPAAPVNGILAALASPYVVARGAVAEVAAPEGTYRQVRSPLADRRTPRPAPGLGEHTHEVLAEALQQRRARQATTAR